MVSAMFRTFYSLLIISTTLAGAQPEELQEQLESIYANWRHSIQTHNDVLWKKVTASHRQAAVKNRLLSEKKRFPADIFNLPALPPVIKNLKCLTIKRSGPTAKAYYFGKIDFGIGGNPADNLLVLSYVGAGNSWQFDQMEYINLALLPDTKKQLAAGELDYLEKTQELLPSGVIPPTPVEIGKVEYIAKVYAYCPGREIQVQINGTSKHLFQDAQEAQLVIGGAKHGRNEIQYTVKKLIDANFKDPMTVRVYIMSEVEGVKPVKIYEHLVPEGQQPEGFGRGTFVIDDQIRNRLLGVAR